MLVQAAIKLNDKIYTGKRHCNIIHDMVITHNVNPKDGVQGFVDEKGNFYNRDDALLYAKTIGQLRKDYIVFGKLTSEDLW